MKQLGQELKKARIDAGLTIEDIFEKTRINPRHLATIERGDFPSLPAAYVRAFIKEYARCVGLNEQAIIERYDKLAEEERGIEPPPPPIADERVLPQPDDTVEFIPPVPKHVVVEGKVEISRDENFQPPVRKSTYLPREKRPGGQPKKPVPRKPAEPPPPGKADAGKSKTPPPKSPPAPGAKKTAPETRGAKPPAQRPPMRKDIQGDAPGKKSIESQPRATGAKKPEKRFIDLIIDDSSSPAGKAEKGKPSIPKVPPRSKAPPPKPPSGRKRGPGHPGGSPPPPRPPKPRQNPMQRRYTAWLILFIVVLSIYTVVRYSEQPVAQLDMRDTTAVDYPTELFVDSTALLLEQPELFPTDTIIESIPEEELALQPEKKVFTQADSMVLEAFTSAPVYYNILMDSVRSERGNLGSNDHKAWKAMDQFLVTVGDAGAITFVLNGVELGNLGESGMLIKNYRITRELLNKGN